MMHKSLTIFLVLLATFAQLATAHVPVRNLKKLYKSSHQNSYAATGAARLNHDIQAKIMNIESEPMDESSVVPQIISARRNKDETSHHEPTRTTTITKQDNMSHKDMLQNQRNMQQQNDDYYQSKPYYSQQSKLSKTQKIALGILVTLTILLGLYSCALHYELSTLNVYSLLGMGNNTVGEEEEKVGDAYVRNDEVEMS